MGVMKLILKFLVVIFVAGKPTFLLRVLKIRAHNMGYSVAKRVLYQKPTQLTISTTIRLIGMQLGSSGLSMGNPFVL